MSINAAAIQTASNRLLTLDIFRGLTIIGMIIVNNPGSWSHVFSPLLHAKWNGVTLTDLVFPFFIFSMGMSVSVALSNRMEGGANRILLIYKIISRSLIIYLLGLFLWVWPEFDFTEVRWVGVLPRIAVVFLICALLFLNTSWRQWMYSGLGLLIAYWLIICYLPIPGIGNPDLSVPEKNWANVLDFQYLPGYLWQKTWDPEGFLSTFPAIVSGISGMLFYTIFQHYREVYQKVSWSFVYGYALYFTGVIWGWEFPLNKHIWTSSYVMYTSGLAAMTFSVIYLIVEIKGFVKWSYVARVFGSNAITAYVLASTLSSVFVIKYGTFPGIKEAWMNLYMNWAIDSKVASLLYAIAYTALIFVPIQLMYKKKIFIKI
jgi:predicted acyltransferase